MTQFQVFFCFVSLTLLGVYQALSVTEAPTPARTEDSVPSKPTPPSRRLEIAEAVPLNDGVGVADIEIQHATWARELAVEDKDEAGKAMESLLLHVATEEGRKAAIAGLVEVTTEDWPRDYRGDFLRALAPGALLIAVETSVPASITMAQAIQESGWGRSGLARHYNNLFGVKSGRRSGGVAMKTREVKEGRTRLVRATFRIFGSWTESIRHHGALLSQDRRYSSARRGWRDWRSYLDQLAPVYATDPEYAQRVGWLIERYDLDRWDSLVVEVVSRRET